MPSVSLKTGDPSISSLTFYQWPPWERNLRIEIHPGTQVVGLSDVSLKNLGIMTWEPNALI